MVKLIFKEHILVLKFWYAEMFALNKSMTSMVALTYRKATEPALTTSTSKYIFKYIPIYIHTGTFHRDVYL